MDDEFESSAETAKQATQTMKTLVSGTKKAASKVNQAIKHIAKIISHAIKILGQFASWLFGLLSSMLPILLPILAVVAAVLIIYCVVTSMFSGGYDPNKATMSSIGGIRGTQFYGARMFYYDDEFTAQDLSDEYKEFTYNILKKINSHHTINIDFTKPYANNIQIEGIVIDFAKAISGSESNVLLDITKSISHYGFTEENKLAVFNSMSNYLINNSYTVATSQNLIAKLNEIYEQDFAYMKNVCKKILIKDYLIEGTNTIKDIPKKNFAGFVYMPRKMIMMKSSFIFAVDEENTVDIAVNIKNNNEVTELATATADNTWMKDGYAENFLEFSSPEDILVSEFTAFNESNIQELSEGKTLFDVLKDGTFNNYFKNVNGSEDVSTLLENINSNNYVYLNLNGTAPFNYSELLAEIKQY